MSNVPKLRFREFSGEWKKRRVDDVYSFKTTNSFSRDALNYESGEVFNIHYGDIHTKFLTSFSLEHEHVPYISSEVQLEKIKKDNYCQVGDLVIADASEDYADIGKAIELIDLDGLDVLAGLHTILARPQRNTFALGFTGRLFQSWTVRKQIMRLSQGAKVLGLSKGYLSEVLLDYPALPEQQKIAAFLTAIDTKIEQLTQKEALLKQYKKGVMQKIFSQEIRFKADDGSEFPEWEEKKFGEVFERITTKNKENNQNVLTISAQQGLVNQQDYFNKSVAAQDVTGYYLLHKDDFAYNKSYSKGYPLGAIKRLTNYKKGVVSTLYICFRAKNCVTAFAEQFFENGGLNREIQKIAQEGARNHGLLNMSVVEFFKDIELPLPCKEEQTKIAELLANIDLKKEQVTKQLTSAQTFKKGLLQQMFV